MRPRHAAVLLSSLLLIVAAGCRSAPTEGSHPSSAPAQGARPLAFSGEIASFDGVPLHVEARGSGAPVLVFVHGWMCKGAYWDAQVADLGEDHATVVLDLAGHGASGDARDTWNLDVLARDVAAVVEQLDLHQVILVGHSMGGPVSLKAAAAMPDRVIGVVGVDTLHDAEFRWPEEMMSGFIAGLEASWGPSMQSFITQSFVDPDAPAAQRLIADMGTANRRVGVALLRSYDGLEMEAVFSACPVPVRCINAAQPKPTRVEVNRKYLGDYDAVLVEDVGHFPQLEDPATVNALLREAVAELSH